MVFELSGEIIDLSGHILSKQKSPATVVLAFFLETQRKIVNAYLAKNEDWKI